MSAIVPMLSNLCMCAFALLYRHSAFLSVRVAGACVSAMVAFDFVFKRVGSGAANDIDKLFVFLVHYGSEQRVMPQMWRVRNEFLTPTTTLDYIRRILYFSFTFGSILWLFARLESSRKSAPKTLH